MEVFSVGIFYGGYSTVHFGEEELLRLVENRDTDSVVSRLWLLWEIGNSYGSSGKALKGFADLK